jgi:hypothetical protein
MNSSRAPDSDAPEAKVDNQVAFLGLVILFVGALFVALASRPWVPGVGAVLGLGAVGAVLRLGAWNYHCARSIGW